MSSEALGVLTEQLHERLRWLVERSGVGEPDGGLLGTTLEQDAADRNRLTGGVNVYEETDDVGIDLSGRVCVHTTSSRGHVVPRLVGDER